MKDSIVHAALTALIRRSKLLPNHESLDLANGSSRPSVFSPWG